jgi:hypothetical protein
MIINHATKSILKVAPFSLGPEVTATSVLLAAFTKCNLQPLDCREQK